MIKSVQPELIKYVDSNVSAAGTAAGIFFTALNMPTTGTGETQMNGTSVSIRKVDFRHETFCAAGGTASFGVRYILVQGLGDSAALTAGEVLQNIATVDFALTSPYRYDTINREFRVLHDSTVVVDGYNTKVVKSYSFNSKVHNARYDSLGTQWATGQLFLLRIAASAASTFSDTFYTRMWFMDV